MKFIEIKMCKTILYLTEDELNKLLSSDFDLWAEAIRRGKVFQRASVLRERTEHKIEQNYFGDKH